MKKLLNILLLVTFIITNAAPITGVHIHKMASAIFLLLCLIHTGIYWKKMNARRFLVLGLIVLAFVSGITGMIFEHITIISAMHTVISIIVVFFLAIHIFVFKSKLCLKKKQ